MPSWDAMRDKNKHQIGELFENKRNGFVSVFDMVMEDRAQIENASTGSVTCRA